MQGLFYSTVPNGISNAEQNDMGWKHPKLKGYDGYVCAKKNCIGKAFGCDGSESDSLHGILLT